MGAIGMLFAHEFPYGSTSLTYRVDFVQYLRPFFLGLLVGMPAGIVTRDLKKMYTVPIVAGVVCVFGHYLWRLVLQGRYLGEAMVIVGPLLSIVFQAGSVSGGVGLGQILTFSEKNSLGRNIASVSLRMLCCVMLCLIFVSLFYSARLVNILVFGFVLGCGSYLIGESHD
ncbi:MAG: hypothetical protein AB7V08_01215 [Elusimicrobiales bacterium]